MLSKSRKKELRILYEKIRGEEYVKWISEQPTYKPFEWLKYKTQIR